MGRHVMGDASTQKMLQLKGLGALEVILNMAAPQ
jgi:hypothetical protein